ncbi:hypothetical protein [Streptomyces sp. NBC_00370]|uniref:hypothetical protein n=1 Tax=Streptomyces sp. NBC_00370 TaxID=2975728 RepID=UPI002E2752F8
MGWTVLYIAFGIVALWLLGEVLLQYKARLRWRLLAFTGFLGVVIGVLMPQIVVIALGAVAFAVGQTYVTLSFRRGFSAGWAVGGSPRENPRRKAQAPAATAEPSLEVSDLQYTPVDYPPVDETAMTAEATGPASIYEPQPMPDDTGQYGVYDTGTGYTVNSPGAQGDYGTGYENYPGYGQQPYAAQGPYPAQDAPYAAQEDTGQDAYAAQQAYPTDQAGYGTQYDYGTGQQQQYAPYSDPYAGSANGGQQYSAYDANGGYQDQQQYADPYAAQQYNDTPPGGVWVPQQREADQQVPPMPQEDPQQQYGYDPNAYNEQQYRY